MNYNNDDFIHLNFHLNSNSDKVIIVFNWFKNVFCRKYGY